MAMNESKLQAILDQYPAKVQKNRKKHIFIKNSEMESQQIEANTRTIPGIITNRVALMRGVRALFLAQLKIWYILFMDQSVVDIMHGIHGGIKQNQTIPNKIFLTIVFLPICRKVTLCLAAKKNSPRSLMK